MISSVSPEFALEISFDANSARVFDRSYRCCRSVILRLVLSGNAGGLVSVVDKLGNGRNRVSGGANDIGYPLAKGKDSPQSYKSGCSGTCRKSSNTRRSITAKSTSVVWPK